MNKRMVKICTILLAVLMHTGTAYAACWNIELRDGTKVRATDFWNLSSKLEESPKSFLLGQVDDEEQQIAVKDIQSIAYQAKESRGWSGWLKGGDVIAQVRFTDGSVSRLKTGLPVFYRTVGQKKRLPASTVMGERADNRDMDLNIFYRARGDVKQIPVDSIAQVERCRNEPEAVREADVIVQHAETSITAGGKGNVDVLGMANGDLLTGQVITTPIRWQTDYGVLELDRSDIREMDIEGNASLRGEVELLSGDRISGHLLNKTLTIHLTIGQSVDVPVTKLRTLKLHEAVTGK